jgi:hypothetical protein
VNEGREVIQSTHVTIKLLHEDPQTGVSESPTGQNENNVNYQLPSSRHSCLVLIKIPGI